MRSNLTLDYGVRFSILQPWYELHDQISNFQPVAYNPKQAVSLYQSISVNGVRSSLNPLTGQTGPAALIGAIVPNSANVYDGIVTPATSTNGRGMVNSQGVLFGPRFGLAWTPLGADRNLAPRPPFNAAGQITNLPTALGGGRFGWGALNAVRSPRTVQLGAKIYFLLRALAPVGPTTNEISDRGFRETPEPARILNCRERRRGWHIIGGSDPGYVAVGRSGYRESGWRARRKTMHPHPRFRREASVPL